MFNQNRDIYGSLPYTANHCQIPLFTAVFYHLNAWIIYTFLPIFLPTKKDLPTTGRSEQSKGNCFLFMDSDVVIYDLVLILIAHFPEFVRTIAVDQVVYDCVERSRCIPICGLSFFVR